MSGSSQYCDCPLGLRISNSGLNELKSYDAIFPCFTVTYFVNLSVLDGLSAEYSKFIKTYSHQFHVISYKCLSRRQKSQSRQVYFIQQNQMYVQNHITCAKKHTLHIFRYWSQRQIIHILKQFSFHECSAKYITCGT